MKVICDIETDGLNPTRIWCVVCKDIATYKRYIFLEHEKEKFKKFSKNVSLWIGHNFIKYDAFHLNRLWGVGISLSDIIDTLVVSRLQNYDQNKPHSLENWGNRLGFKKIEFNDYSKFSDEMLEYCIQDVELNHRVFKFLLPYILDKRNKEALRLEHDTEFLCNRLKLYGFPFDIKRAKSLHLNITERLDVLRLELRKIFPKRAYSIREVVPRATKAGTIHLGDFRWERDDLTPYSIGSAFTRIGWEEFNPASTKQCVERLNELGWNPKDKTKGHLQALKNKKISKENLEYFKVYGWKVNEENLNTILEDAPEGSRRLVEYLILDSRRTTLEEWFKAYNEKSGAIHGNFNGIGAWTHRFSHSNPNSANIPAPKSGHINKELRDLVIYYGTEFRRCWITRSGYKLLGVDAESIQLRILAHYMDDEEFTNSLVYGSKKDGTDPHSVHANLLGIGRERAKTFIYAWVLGSGIDKNREILYTNSIEETKEKLNLFVNRYPGLKHLKEEIIPKDAERGWFRGIDGRKVPIPQPHKTLAGYLQNGESTIMKRAFIDWNRKFKEAGIDYLPHNFVHDEWQTGIRNDPEMLELGAKIQSNSIRLAGEYYKLKCPMSGNASEPGNNWFDTH